MSSQKWLLEIKPSKKEWQFKVNLKTTKSTGDENWQNSEGDAWMSSGGVPISESFQLLSKQSPGDQPERAN